MPYELEYKKVHNTLKNKTLENHYGCTKGKIPNLLGSLDSNSFVVEKLLTKDNQYLVIQNNTSSSQTATIEISTKSSQNLESTNTIEVNGNDNIIVRLPTNAPVIQNGQKIPYLIKFIFTNIHSNTEISAWETESDILGYEEDNLIVRTEKPEEIIPIYIDNLDWNKINSFLDNVVCSFVSSDNDGNARLRFTFPQDEEEIVPLLKRNHFDLVLVPVRAKTEQPLKSITNMRNIKQTDLYADKYRKVSLYLEPIKLNVPTLTSPETLVYFNFIAPQNAPLPTSAFNSTLSKRGYTTYGLISNDDNTNESNALFVCRGCGYDEGRDGGVTKIKLALGLQLQKEESRHSGCSLSYFRVLGDDNNIITLNRLALTRNDNQNCIIYLTPLNEQ